jgi:hypothetical protein
MSSLIGEIENFGIAAQIEHLPWLRSCCLQLRAGVKARLR